MTLSAYSPELLETPFHGRFAALNKANDWHGWNGYQVATSFADEGIEYFAIRNSSSLFDLSPMNKYRITGPDAESYLNRLLTRDVTKVRVGRVAYSVWCTDEGRVIDDGTLFRLGEQDFMLCAQERHMEWLMISKLGFDVTLEDATSGIGTLALQGPTSCSILQAVGLEGIEQLKPFRLDTFSFGGGEVMVSRTGFTGDLGYELWVEPRLAERLFDRLMKEGEPFGLAPIGSNALTRARIEAGFIQAGEDFMPAHHTVRPGHDRSPFELGLDWLVDFDKPNFNGKQALLKENERGSKFRLVKLDIDGNKQACDAYIYHGKNKMIGAVTSATWSPILKANIALASIDWHYGQPGDDLWVEIYYQRELRWQKVWAKARVIDGAFFDPPRRRAVPAGKF